MRRIILERAYHAGVGHIGSALSVVDIIAALYAGTLRIPGPGHPERDRFVLSKGHAALALYAALFLKGWISEETLKTYCTDDTLLGTHPERRLPGVDFGSGSLGAGMSYAVGAALAARMQHSTRRVFALVSDAECNQGIVWEAALFAAHHRLANLHVIIDLNGQQALGYTRDVLDLEPLAEKWQAFGWDTQQVDGHSPQAIAAALESRTQEPARPHVLLAQTTFGKGVPFMENKIKWHYWPMSEEEYALALENIL